MKIQLFPLSIGAASCNQGCTVCKWHQKSREYLPTIFASLDNISIVIDQLFIAKITHTFFAFLIKKGFIIKVARSNERKNIFQARDILRGRLFAADWGDLEKSGKGSSFMFQRSSEGFSTFAFHISPEF